MSMLDTLQKWQTTLAVGTLLSRRAWASVSYTPKGSTETTDISEDLMQYLLSIDYNDNMMDQVDDITLTLEDKAQLWQNQWFPEPGSKIDLTIYTINKESLDDGVKQLHVGVFEVDQIDVNGMPSTVEIKAVSADSSGSLRGEKKNRTWENISVWKCASDIASENGLQLAWYCDDNPNLDHTEQSDESDLEFLRKVVKDAGFCLKVDAKRIIIFDEQKQEEGDALIYFVRPGTYLRADALQTEKQGPVPKQVDTFTSYRMTSKTRDTYQACHVRYKNGKEGEVIEATYTAPDGTQGQTLEVNEQVHDTAEAERLAKKKLREKNKEAVTCSFGLYGDFIYAAGALIQLKNFGKFDGKYIVTKVNHHLGSGYTCSLDMRRCLHGY